MNRVGIKERAKELLSKNHWLCVGVALLATLTLGGTGASFSVNLDFPTQSTGDYSFSAPDFDISTIIFAILAIIIIIVVLVSSTAMTVFVTNQFKVGSCRFFLKYRKNHPVKVDEVFQSYRDKTFLNVAKVTFIRDLIVGLWGLLFIIPGIIKSYEYFAVNYILSVRPDMDYSSALDLSKRIMNGHKAELFELHFSFIGWHLLSLFTCAILSVCYVSPYLQIAEAEFYSMVRDDAIYRGIITPFDIPDYEEAVVQPPIYNNPVFVNQQLTYTGTYTEPVQPMQTVQSIQPIPEPITELPKEPTQE